MPTISKIRPSQGPPSRWQRFALAAVPVAVLGLGGVYAKFFYGEGERQAKLERLAQTMAYRDDTVWDKLRNHPANPRCSQIPNSDSALDHLVLTEEVLDGSVWGRTPTISLPLTTPHWEIRDLVQQASPISLGIQSTMPNDPLEFESTQYPFGLRVPNMPFRYAQIYNIAQDRPDREMRVPLTATAILLGVVVPTNIPHVIGSHFYIEFERCGERVRFAFIPSSMMRRTPHHIPYPAYSTVLHFARQLDRVSHVLHERHPDLHLANLRVLLYDDLLTELLDLNEVDLIQDRSACRFSACRWRSHFDLAFAEVSPKVRIFDKPRIPPNWLWPLASYGSAKYDLDKQAFGLSQVILGLAKAVCRTPEIRRAYHPWIQERDCEGDRAMLRALLEPDKGIAFRAATLDYVLTQLKQTLFRDPRMRYPTNRSPFIWNDQTAREFGLLATAYELMVYPDLDDIISRSFADTGRGWFGWRQRMTGDIFNIEPEYPGLFHASVPSASGNPLRLGYLVEH